MTVEAAEGKIQKNDKGREVEMAEDRPVFVPATDIYEKRDSILVVCDMPGVDQKHIDVTLEDDVLTLIGHQESNAPENRQLLHRGYRTGIFRRSFTIRAEIDHDRITAQACNGVLKVVLPKSERAKPRKIAVQAS